MARSTVSVLVYHNQIDAMNMPRGMVYRYVQDKGRRTTVIAKAIAPVRKGTLRAGIGTAQPRFSRNSVRLGASSRAAHSRYVIEGTGPMIFVDTTKNGFFWLPRSRGSAFRMRYRHDIRGQQANNFLERALSQSLKSPFGPRGLLYGPNPFG